MTVTVDAPSDAIGWIGWTALADERRVAGPLEVEGDGVGVQVGAVVELDALADDEGPHRGVLVRRERLEQVRVRLAVGAADRQGLVDGAADRRVARRRAEHLIAAATAGRCRPRRRRRACRPAPAPVRPPSVVGVSPSAPVLGVASSPSPAVVATATGGDERGDGEGPRVRRSRVHGTSSRSIGVSRAGSRRSRPA